MKRHVLENLMTMMSKLPGFGPKSARRAVLHMVKFPHQLMLPLAEALKIVAEEVKLCSICQNIDVTPICSICHDQSRDPTILCVVESVSDLWAMERAASFKGRYHVLGGTLSAIEGRTPESLQLYKIAERLEAHPEIKEVIIATNATLEGETTAYYIVDMIRPYGPHVSHLAHGIPIGGELDYMDEGTISLAFKMRQGF
jgi:recombination protein RecR